MRLNGMRIALLALVGLAFGGCSDDDDDNSAAAAAPAPNPPGSPAPDPDPGPDPGPPPPSPDPDPDPDPPPPQPGWIQQDTGTELTFTAVSAVDVNHAWAAAGSDVFRTTNGGATWTFISQTPP